MFLYNLYWCPLVCECEVRLNSKSSSLFESELKFIRTLWSVDQIAQFITINDSRVHKNEKQ